MILRKVIKEYFFSLLTCTIIALISYIISSFFDDNLEGFKETFKTFGGSTLFALLTSYSIAVLINFITENESFRELANRMAALAIDGTLLVVVYLAFINFKYQIITGLFFWVIIGSATLIAPLFILLYELSKNFKAKTKSDEEQE